MRIKPAEIDLFSSLRIAFGLALVASLGLAIACSSKKPDPKPELDPDAKRTITQGVLLGGKDLYNSHSWLSIPYARPPVGELRWKAPAAPLPWSEEREAIRFGPACTQLASSLGGAANLPVGSARGSEDCLTLNVYAPRLQPNAVPRGSEKLPVVLWIHGGANRSGSADFYNGGNLAATHNLIVVTVNYRLGPLGWFSHPALAATAGSKEEASGNFAVLDLMAALQWIRQNAAAFGGDSERVTIMGESAGANNVLALLLSPHARGLFHRAIMQSALPRFVTQSFASGDPQAGAHPNSSGDIAARLLVAEGRAPDHEAAQKLAREMAPLELANFLRSFEAIRIIDAFRNNLNNENTELAFYEFPALFQDGDLIPTGELAQQIRAGGDVKTVPVLIGGNRDEENLYLAIDDQYMYRYFGLIPSISEPELYDAIGDHLSRAWNVLGLHRPARAIQSVNPNVFAFRFDWDEEPVLFGTDLGLALGAAHAFDVPFVFGHYRLGAADRYMFTEENLPGRQDLAGAMMSYWANFARTGRPGRGAADEESSWETYGPEERLMLLDTTTGGGRRMLAQPLTRASVLNDVQSDSRLDPDDWRCRVYRRMVDKNRLLEQDELKGVGCD